MLRWFVVRTKPRSENVAATELTLNGIEVFLPRVKANPPPADQAYTPLFPGYLFLRCDPDLQGWPTFLPAHRIIGWVMVGPEIPWITDEDMVALKDYCDATNHDGCLWQFLAGETVCVTSDHFPGLAQVVANSTSPNAQVVVRLAFMGRTVRAHVPWQNLLRMEGQGLREEGTDRDATPKVTAPRGTRGRKRWIRHRQSS
jgi:transcription antitermination factor NusG